MIKKKVGGRYFTLNYTKVLEGEYDRQKRPSLLPEDEWIGLKVEVNDIADSSVEIKLYVDWNRSGDWELVTQTVDDGKHYGVSAIHKAGFGGIRSDFVDVKFDDTIFPKSESV